MATNSEKAVISLQTIFVTASILLIIGLSLFTNIIPVVGVIVDPFLIGLITNPFGYATISVTVGAFLITCVLLIGNLARSKTSWNYGSTKYGWGLCKIGMGVSFILMLVIIICASLGETFVKSQGSSI